MCSCAHVWLGGAQLRQKLTIDCAHAMNCDGACLLQPSVGKFPFAFTHGCRHVLMCSYVALRCSCAEWLGGAQRRIHGYSTHLTPFTQRICFFPAPTRVMCTLVAFLTKPLVCVCVCVQAVRSQDFIPTFRYCSCNCMCWVAWRCSATPETND